MITVGYVITKSSTRKSPTDMHMYFKGWNRAENPDDYVPQYTGHLRDALIYDMRHVAEDEMKHVHNADVTRYHRVRPVKV